MENAHPGKCQNGNCTPWKMTEKSHPGKWQKIYNLNLPEWKIHAPENARTEIARPGNWQKINPSVLKWWNTTSSNFQYFRPKMWLSLLLNFSKMSVLGPPWVNLDITQTFHSEWNKHYEKICFLHFWPNKGGLGGINRFDPPTFLAIFCQFFVGGRGGVVITSS